MVAIEMFRKNSRKYDLAEHEYPKELDMLAAVIEGSNGAAGARGRRGRRRQRLEAEVRGRQPQRHATWRRCSG